MADRNALGVIGYILGAITAAVMIIGVLVVNDNIASARDDLVASGGPHVIVPVTLR